MSKTDIIERELCRADDFHNNTMKEIEVKLDDTSTFKVLLIKHDEEFSCVAPLCTQHSVPLSSGVLYKTRIRCMADGASYDIKTGNLDHYPGPDSLPFYEVKVDSNGMVQLKATREELESKYRIKKDQSKQPEKPAVLTAERFERPKGSASMQRPKTSLANRAGSANTRNRIQVIPKEALERVNKKLPKCLIIGSGPAGLICMDTLREYGFYAVETSLINVITNDPHLPYERPSISKKLEIDTDSIKLRDKEYFVKNNINYQMNEEVEKIDFDSKKVTCKSGQSIAYDKLIISTGMKPNSVPDKPGSNLKGIFTIKNLENAKAITAYFKHLNENNNGQKINVVFIGGSFISMESVCFFIEKQANATIVSRSKPFEKTFGTEVSSKIADLYESKGVKFLINKDLEVKEFKENNGALSSVELVTGESLPCDICILAMGGNPCTDFLNDTTLKLTSCNKIIVDKNMKTNINDVYATGDIASFPLSCIPGLDFMNKSDLPNISHWGLACQQGRTAALSIVNLTRTEQIDNELKAVPFIWSTLFGKTIRFSGMNDQFDSVVYYDDKSNPHKFAAFYILSNKVVGVSTMDWDPLCAIFAEAMFNKIEVRKEHIEKDPFDLKKLLLI